MKYTISLSDFHMYSIKLTIVNKEIPWICLVADRRGVLSEDSSDLRKDTSDNYSEAEQVLVIIFERIVKSSGDNSRRDKMNNDHGFNETVDEQNMSIEEIELSQKILKESQDARDAEECALDMKGKREKAVNLM